MVGEDTDSDDHAPAIAHQVCVCDDGKAVDKHEENPIIEVDSVVHDFNPVRRTSKVHNSNLTLCLHCLMNMGSQRGFTL